MNPVLQSSSSPPPRSYEYTVLGSRCFDATEERPWMAEATPPPGRPAAAWQELISAVYAYPYVRNKTLFGFCLTVCFGLGNVVYKIFFYDETRVHSKPQLYDCVFLAFFMCLTLFLNAALEGSCHHGHVQSAIDRLQPQWAESGWELQFHSNGRLFFRAGYVSITPVTYQAPPRTDGSKTEVV